ncbi:MAG: hypothetical protein AB1752_08890 [Candidatus Zixiibacteriota bacterium]
MIRRLCRKLTILTVLVSLTAAPARAAERPVAAERLTIQWTEGAMQILSRTPLLKILPPTVTLPDSTNGLRGAWFEVQSDKGDVLYRRLMPAINIVFTETPLDPGSGQLSRAEAPVESQVFSVLVPASAAVKRVVFHGPDPAAKTSRTLSTEIGRIDLK